MSVKKDELLRALDINQKKNIRFIKNIGSGFFLKIRRLIHSPILYTKYVFYTIFLKNRLIRTKLFWKKEIQIRLIDKNALSLAFFGLLIDEINVIKYFIKYSSESDIFYDIGANHGFYTHLFSDLCHEVHTFEPTPAVFSNLVINFNHTKNVFLNRVALSDKNGSADLYLAKSSGPNTILEEVAKRRRLENNKVSVKTSTLDEYVKYHKYPTLIKIDVEGAENLVIHGGENIFKNFSPLVVMEVWSDSREMDQRISARAVDTLRGFGYES